ncbi:MAG: rod shape-determining protein, partial [Proteobacteria bacterium]|nr:rod shape-determining protein [Pseudomonadota bacterium]
MSTVELNTPLLQPIEIPSPLRILKNLWSNDIAMDLGTANTLIYARGRGIVLNEPSIVAVDERSGKAVAVGHAAKEMYGKTSAAVRCIRPMKDGVIADFENTAVMIEYMLRQVRGKTNWGGFSLRRPRIVIGVPSGITQVEKRAVIDAATSTGISEVMLMEESMAAALGSGLPVDQSVGNMIIDIGGGTTEVAIITLNSTLYSHSIRVAGDEMDEAIQRLLRKSYGLQVGIFEAERVKLVIGSALPLGKQRTILVSGRDLTNGIPRQVEVRDDEVREALDEPISAITASIVTALEQTSPEVAHDIASRGI